MTVGSPLFWLIAGTLVVGVLVGLGVTLAAMWNRRLTGGRAEQKSRDRVSGDFSQSLIQSMKDGVALLDTKGTHLDCNRAFCAMTGFLREEIVGSRSPKPYWPPEHFETLRSSFRRALEGRTETVEVVFMRKNGDRFPVLITPSFFRGDDGELRVFTTYRDITDLKRVEQELLESQAFLTKAQQVAGIGSWQWSFATNDVRWSDEMCRINGVSPAEFDGTLEGSIRAVHPDDRQEVNDAIAQVVMSRRATPLQYRIVWPDGTVHAVRGEGDFYYDDSGNPLGMIGTLQDVTRHTEAELALRQSEEQFRTIFENAPVMIDSFDSAGRCLLWNQECERQLGWSAEEIREVADPLALFYPDAETRNGVLADISRTDGQFREYEVLARDGSVHIQLWANFRLPNGNVISVGHDITRRKQAEREIQKSQRQLRALASRLHNVRERESAFIGREVHDELGQKLTGLKLDLAWIQRRFASHDRGVTPEELLLKLDGMSSGIDEMVGAVRRISTQLRPIVLDNLGLVGALEWQAKEFADRTGIVCELRLETERLDLGTERSSAVFRIFQEVLTNAARHSRASRVDVEVGVRNQTMLMTVADDGVGITPDQIADPNALGLVGMRERVLICGGRFRINRGRNGGTQVRVEVPMEVEGKDTPSQHGTEWSAGEGR